MLWNPISVDAVARLAEAPELPAIILDVDGTLAPIVPRARGSGRPAGDARRARASRRVATACSHSSAGGSGRTRAAWSASTAPRTSASTAWSSSPRRRLAGAAAELASAEWPWGDVEDKGLTVSFHYRNAATRRPPCARPSRSRCGRGASGSSRASAARCSRSGPRSTRTRERPCVSSSARPAWPARSSPVTTRPISTRSAACGRRGSSSPSASPSRSAEGPPELVRAGRPRGRAAPAGVLELLRQL